MKHGCTVIIPKPSNSHHHNPRDRAKCSLNKGDAYRFFFYQESIVHHEYDAQRPTMNSHFHYKYLDISLMQFTINNQEMAVRRMADSTWQCTGTFSPTCGAVLARNHIPQGCQPPYSPDMVKCAFFLIP
jgi:hypothetical protein